MLDNNVTVVGRVYEKQLRYTKNGNAVMNLRVGVKENEKTTLTVLDVVMWGKMAEQADKVMTDKCRIALEGALRQDRWENTEGQKRTKLYIKANRFLLIQSIPYVDKDNDNNASESCKEQPESPEITQKVTEENGEGMPF
jgi:single-strand DNA-binding protein